MKQAKINYNTVDVVKFLLAILLVCAHTASERVNLPTILDSFCSLYIIAVPFFFIASSFFFFKKLTLTDNTKNIYRHWSKRIGMMYLAWSSIYICFVVINWIQNEASTGTIFEWLHKAIVFSTYPTIWFLPALWIAVSLVYWLKYKKKYSNKTILGIALLLYIIGSIEYSYYNINPILNMINQSYEAIMKTWRNGLFNGFIFAAIGLCIVQKEEMKISKSLLGTCFFGVFFIAEALIMKKINPSSDANFLFMLVPFSYFFFHLVCKIQIPNSPRFIILRKMSMVIFLSQRLFLSAIPSIIHSGAITGVWDLTENGTVALILVLLEIYLFSYILLKLASKIKLLQYLI